jgi:tryptophan synthase alpha chain
MNNPKGKGIAEVFGLQPEIAASPMAPRNDRRESDAFGPKAFVAFLTAGDPDLDSTYDNIVALIEGGADIIELGIPFSDPIADGPVIMEADIRALKNNYNIDDIFCLVERVREKYDTPLVFLTYLNPVHHYGYKRFFMKCNQWGVQGIVIPDLPFEEQAEIKRFTDFFKVKLITLIAPTSKDRVKKLATDAEGFIYLVSSLGITGERTSFSSNLDEIVAEIRKYTDTPICVGFGISTPEQAGAMAKISDGAIIGSKIVRLISENTTNAPEILKEFAQNIKGAFRTHLDAKAELC